MPILSAETARQLQIAQELARVTPLSEPGKARWAQGPFFAPGDEALLGAAYDRSDWLRGVEGSRPLLERALSGLADLDVLQADPAQWGIMELALIARILNALQTIKSWIQETGAPSWSSSFVPDKGLALLAPHARGSTFSLSPQSESERGAKATLDEAQSEWLQCAARHRATLADKLGVSPSRLRSDFVVSSDDKESEQQLLATGRFTLVETTRWQQKFRYQPPEEVIAARKKKEAAQRSYAAVMEVARQGLCKSLEHALRGVDAAIDAATTLDLDLARAAHGELTGGVRPLLSRDVLRFRMATNPVLAAELGRVGRTCQPLSCALDKKVVSLFGSNMGGKSSFLRTVGLLQTMVQAGLYVTAASWEGPLFSHIAWVGSGQDDSLRGLSSFGREITLLSEALAHEGRLLLLMDEFGRSTSYEEGRDLSRSLMQYFLKNKSGRLVMAGHIRALADLEGTRAYQTGGFDPGLLQSEHSSGHSLERISGAMDYSVHPYGGAASSDASAIARLLGLPFEIEGEG